MNQPPDIQNTHFDFSSPTAEQNVIAELITGSPHTRKLLDHLKPEDFVTEHNAKLFVNLVKCFESGNIDAYGDKLIESGYLPIPSRHMRLWDAASVIVDNSQKRALWKFSVQLHQNLGDPSQKASELQDVARAALIEAIDNRTSDMPIDFSESVIAAHKSMETNSVAMMTGIDELDKKVRILSDSVVVVGARPSQGKTAFGLSVIHNNLEAGKMPALCSMEMNDATIIKRLVSISSGVGFRHIIDGWSGMNDEQCRSVKAAYDMVRDFKVHKKWLKCSGRVSVNQVRDWLDIVRPDFAVLDYGQLMNATKKRQSRREELGDITGDIRELASDTNIPIILLAQLNRSSDEDNQPKMKHIRESGTFEQDATDVILIDRPESGSNPTPVKRSYEDPTTGNQLELVSENGKPTGNACLLIDKQRNGACGYCPVKFTGPTMKFYDFPTEAPNW